MKIIEKLTIKYLIIGSSIVLLYFLLAISGIYTNIYSTYENSIYISFAKHFTLAASNIIIGIFIMLDTLKYCKNKLTIIIIGFLMPIFGVCFLLLEYFLILKLKHHE